jgi:hypothetical protein
VVGYQSCRVPQGFEFYLHGRKNLKYRKIKLAFLICNHFLSIYINIFPHMNTSVLSE